MTNTNYYYGTERVLHSFILFFISVVFIALAWFSPGFVAYKMNEQSSCARIRVKPSGRLATGVRWNAGPLQKL